MKPGDVGRRFSGSVKSLAAAPSGIYVPADLSPEPPRGGPSRPPEPAGEAELEDLRQRLREALFKVTCESTRLDALQQARERACIERRGAQQALDEAKAALAHARQFGRRHLVAAYVNQQEITSASPENAQAERDLRLEQLQHAEEIEAALDEEIARSKSDLRDHALRRDIAAGSLVSRSPEFLHLVKRIPSAFAELRSVRLCIRESCGPIHLDGWLLDLAQSNQPTNGARYAGYDLDEDLIRVWNEAVTALLRDADAPLPPIAPT